MAEQNQITLYGTWYSPFSQRVTMALVEAKAEYTVHEINLQDKPSWFVQKVNSFGEVPAITYGGPKVPPEEPSPESVKLKESSVILQFLGETFPDSKLVPVDPVKRARARIFVKVFDDQWVRPFRMFVYGEGSFEPILEALEVVQGLLPETGFAVGEWSFADIAAASFLPLFLMTCEHEIGNFPFGDGKKVLKEIATPKFARIRRYIEDIEEQPSFKATFDKEKELLFWKSTPYGQRN